MENRAIDAVTVDAVTSRENGDTGHVTNGTLIYGQVDIDPERVKARWAAALLDPAPKPLLWTADLVGERLVEACRTIARTRMRTRPAEHSTLWPAYRGMTQAEQNQLANELWQAGMTADWNAEKNRVSIPPSGEQIERADEAIVWPMRYLRDDPGTAAIVTAWAGDVYECRDLMPKAVQPGLDVIAQGLNRDRVRVR